MCRNQLNKMRLWWASLTGGAGVDDGWRANVADGWEEEADGWHWRGEIPFDGQPRPRFPADFDAAISYSLLEPVAPVLRPAEQTIAELYEIDLAKAGAVVAGDLTEDGELVLRSNADPLDTYYVILPPPEGGTVYHIRGYIPGFEAMDKKYWREDLGAFVVPDEDLDVV